MPFETAYRLYHHPLVLSVRQRATAWGLSERDVDVEALVQDTFEQALRVWDSIRVPRSRIYTVARRRLARCTSTAAPRAEGDPADHTVQGTVGWSTIAAAAGTEDLVAAREIVHLVQLMPQQRRQEVAYLRYIEEWGFNEITEQLGCCPATARVPALNTRVHVVATASSSGRVPQAGLRRAGTSPSSAAPSAAPPALPGPAAAGWWLCSCSAVCLQRASWLAVPGCRPWLEVLLPLPADRSAAPAVPHPRARVRG